MFEILHELTIAAPQERVYEAVTTPDGLAGWWTRDVEAVPEVGSTSTFGFEQHSVLIRMLVDVLEPPEAVHWRCVEGPDEWVKTEVGFRIEAVDDTHTLVRFWHGNWEYDNGALPNCSFQWAMYLDSLRRYLETGEGSPAG